MDNHRQWANKKLGGKEGIVGCIIGILVAMFSKAKRLIHTQTPVKPVKAALQTIKLFLICIVFTITTIIYWLLAA